LATGLGVALGPVMGAVFELIGQRHVKGFLMGSIIALGEILSASGAALIDAVVHRAAIPVPSPLPRRRGVSSRAESHNFWIRRPPRLHALRALPCCASGLRRMLVCLAGHLPEPREYQRLPLFDLSDRIGGYGHAHRHYPQDLQVQAAPHARASASAGAGNSLEALPHALQYGIGTTPYLVAARAGQRRQLLPTEGRITRPESGVSRVCGSAFAGLAGCAAARRARVPSLLPPGAGRQVPRLPALPGPGRYHSFTYPQFDNGARLDNGTLVLSKIGRIGIHWSRPLEGTPKTVTLSKEADGWYVCFSCADVPTQPLPLTGRETGIDVGLKVFLVTADGDEVENPRHYRRGEKRLVKAQRRVSRRQKGSNRRKKAVGLLAKAHQHVKRQRADHHHKTALALLRDYDTIYVEDLRVANLVRNRHLAKSISDAGWAAFRTLLEAKAAWAGRQVLAVPPAYTSQDCSGCGARVPKSLSVRTHVCPSCGLVLDRDLNAARNILRAGQARQGAVALAAVLN
jgi:putative transposase